MSTYVVIEDVAYPTNSVEEIENVQMVLESLGMASTPVYCGDPNSPDSYLNGGIVFSPVGQPGQYREHEIERQEWQNLRG